MSYAKKKPYVKPEAVVRIPFKPKFKPSEAQEKIFAEIENDGHVHIDACAGSGKSTTLVWTMMLEHEKMLRKNKRISAAMLAFNKSIVTHIEPMCAPHVDVSTCHSFGYKAIAKRYGRLFVSQNKVQNIFKEIFPNLDPDNMNGKERGAGYAFMFDYLKLVDMLRAYLYDEKDAGKVSEIIGTFGLESLDDLDLVMSLLGPTFKKMLEKPNVIDFTDMMWIPLRLDLDVPKYDTLYIDERQDLNSMMIAYAAKMCGGRVFTCGDKYQSIYAFGGADPRSTERLIAQFEGKELPLNVCYRCGTDIVALAQKIHPLIMPYEGNEKGIINDDDATLDFNMPDGSMVISRRNASLVRHCFTMLKNGRKAIIKGKDIGASLLKIVKSIKADNTIEFIDNLEIHKQTRIDKLLKQKNVNESMVEKIIDECDCLREIAIGSPTISEMEKRIENLFDESTPGVTFSSCHRAKGLESDMVTIVDYNRIRISRDGMTQDQRDQERNLEYVAVTRPKKRLDLVR